MARSGDGANHEVTGSHESTKMTRRTWFAIFPILFFAGSVAQAQTTIDVTKITCGQFMSLSVASPDTIAIWLNGYYHGLRGKTLIDVQQLKDQPQNMTSFCLYNGKGGTITVMEVAEKLLTSGK
jgi:hypothetical protein